MLPAVLPALTATPAPAEYCNKTKIKVGSLSSPCNRKHPLKMTLTHTNRHTDRLTEPSALNYFIINQKIYSLHTKYILCSIINITICQRKSRQNDTHTYRHSDSHTDIYRYRPRLARLIIRLDDYLKKYPFFYTYQLRLICVQNFMMLE